jgi:REP element-mobilizing transposase RayT
MSSNVVAGHVRQPRCEGGTDTCDFAAYARAVRIELADGIHHVTMRGNNRATIFHDDRDYEAFLGRLASTVKDFAWLLHAYVVMPNHFHLLVETPQPNLGRGMLILNGSYARRYNARYDHVGHVFQTPYSSKLVLTDAHFVESCRYIVNNPVRAGLCARPDQWRWTSYHGMAGLSFPPDFLHLARLRAAFDSPEEFATFTAAKNMSSNHVAGHGPVGR